MRNIIEKRLGSALYTKIQTLQMPRAEREKALRAMYDAQLAVDAFAWLTKKIERLGERLFLKPALSR